VSSEYTNIVYCMRYEKSLDVSTIKINMYLCIHSINPRYTNHLILYMHDSYYFLVLFI